MNFQEVRDALRNAGMKVSAEVVPNGSIPFYSPEMEVLSSLVFDGKNKMIEVEVSRFTVGMSVGIEESLVSMVVEKFSRMGSKVKMPNYVGYGSWHIFGLAVWIECPVGYLVVEEW